MEPLNEISFPYAFAKKCADRIIELLQPHCEIINIAGSVRREKFYVKDIEVVCIPKKISVQTDLFGGIKEFIDPEFGSAIDLMKKEVVKGNVFGKYMQIVLIGNIKLDLFMPSSEDYYRQFVIRTGSADFAHKVIANQWGKLGWVGTSQGLRRRKDCYPNTDKKTGKITSWAIQYPSGEKPPVWISEKDFFEWLGIRYIEPKYR